MTFLEPQRGNIPTPKPSVLSRPYWEGCARGELLFLRCAGCQAATASPAMVCAQCHSTALRWERSSGRGDVYSWTTVWRPAAPEFTVPYVAVIVDLAEGWQLLSNLIGCEHDAVTISMSVAVTFHRTAGGAALPYFRPA